MPISTIQLTEKALKDFYLSVIQEQMDDYAGAFLSMVEKTTQHVEGKSIKMPLKYGRSGGVGSRSENGDLPEPNPRKYEMATWDTKNIYARIMLTDKLIRASRSNKGAFAKMLESQLEDVTNDAKNDFQRQLFGDGTGVLATTGAVTAQTVVPVDSVRFLSEGMYVDVVASDGTVKNEKLEIIVRDKTAGTVTLSSAVDTLATDQLVVSGSYGNELTGLKSIFTPDSTLYGIDRSANKWFNPNVKAHNAELDEIVMQEMIDEAKEETGSVIDYIQCSNGVARAFQYYNLTYKRNVETMELKGGFKVMSYNGIPLSREKYEEEGAMRFLNSKDFKIYRIDDWEFMQDDGAILSRVAGKPSYEATLLFYGDLGCSKPRGQSLLTGITEH